MGSSVFSFVQKAQKVRFLVYILAHFAMAVETKIFLSKKKKTIMSEYRSPLVEPEPVPEPVKATESPVPEKVDEVNPEISKSAHSVESVKESDSSESDEEFSDCESEDEIQTDPRFFHSSVPCTHQAHYIWLSHPKRRLPWAFTDSQLGWSPYQHPLYQTSNNVYGAIPTRLGALPVTYHGKVPIFSMSYRQIEVMENCGMYKNHGLNTSLDSSKVYDDPRL